MTRTQIIIALAAIGISAASSWGLYAFVVSEIGHF